MKKTYNTPVIEVVCGNFHQSILNATIVTGNDKFDPEDTNTGFNVGAKGDSWGFDDEEEADLDW